MGYDGMIRPPSSYEATPTDEKFVSFLATVYEHLVNLTPPCKGKITRFHASKVPDVSIKDYLQRIQTYFGCSNECFVLSLVYIDRIVKIYDDFSVSILNVHRLLITSVMLATKFFDDVYYSNAFYARVGGVMAKEINILEAHFLDLLDFHLFVSPEEYDAYRRNVFVAASRQHLHRRLPLPTPSTELLDPYAIQGSGCTNVRGGSSLEVGAVPRNHPPPQFQQVHHMAGTRHAAPNPLGTSSAAHNTFAYQQHPPHRMSNQVTLNAHQWNVASSSIHNTQHACSTAIVSQPVIGGPGGYAEHPNLQMVHNPPQLVGAAPVVEPSDSSVNHCGPSHLQNDAPTASRSVYYYDTSSFSGEHAPLAVKQNSAESFVRSLLGAPAAPQPIGAAPHGMVPSDLVAVSF